MPSNTEAIVVANFLEDLWAHTTLGTLAVIFLIVKLDATAIVNGLLDDLHFFGELTGRFRGAAVKLGSSMAAFVTSAAQHYEIALQMGASLANWASMVNLDIAAATAGFTARVSRDGLASPLRPVRRIGYPSVVHVGQRSAQL